ncbi:hypothetical protein H4R18_005382, partial [Coemansia javaensis]
MAARQTASIASGAITVDIPAPPAVYDRLCTLASTLGVSKQPASAIELHACFLEHCAQNDEAAAVAVLEAMCREHGIPDTNIHIVIQQHGLDEDAAQRVLRAYYRLWSVQGARHCYFAAEKPALLASGAARPMAMFGGQPGSGAYLAEARWLLDVYRPLVGDYASRMAAFLSGLAQDGRLAPVYDRGLDVLRWLAHPPS